jgi:hypothetical protein
VNARASVSGEHNRTAPEQEDWVAGDLVEED